MLSKARSRLLARLRNSRTRSKEGLVLVEGVRAGGEALASGVPIRFAVCSEALQRTKEGNRLSEGLDARSVPTDWVESSELATHAATESPQGLLLICDEPRWSLEGLPDPAGARLLVADGVRDPGNLGTLMRSAFAFGLTAIVALDGTVDPWNAKVVRASAGTCLRTPVVRATWEELAAWANGVGARIIVADASGTEVRAEAASAPWVLVMGGEADGPRDAVRAIAHSVVAIPMPGRAESLNVAVAGGIVMYELTRQASGVDEDHGQVEVR